MSSYQSSLRSCGSSVTLSSTASTSSRQPSTLHPSRSFSSLESQSSSLPNDISTLYPIHKLDSAPASTSDLYYTHRQQILASLSGSPLGSGHYADPATGASKTIQIICKLFPKSSLAKKMQAAEEKGEQLITQMKDEEKRARKCANVKSVKEKDQMMADEFGRLGL